MITEKDRKYLKRCIELAREALEKGNAPFGSILVSQNGEVLFEDHNRTSGGDNTQHPEFAIARWTANNMQETDRLHATVYTSGEHCSMCASAHALAGLGRIVYASSTRQLKEWKEEMDAAPGRLKGLSIQEVVNDIEVDGPDEFLSEEVKELQFAYLESQKESR
ncbi:nucleoside deaminase [Salinicoccus roseus]|uniref:tRNA-specific adenosine deaminase n=1 Tax=Salinicoccus roseus TaxID=45670 RepID=A0A265E4P9_9STAP|nr:nucleoside deaminase [Salinicoccus roseus]OZT76426.1 tRNA-specific adenosine deaminase [Salinicoccus roseus]